jgi:subfamily B ATP-binding cassette protein MsbA
MASISQRLARIAPYLKSGRRALVLAGLGAVVGASTEPMIPALLQPLLDQGFTSARTAAVEHPGGADRALLRARPGRLRGAVRPGLGGAERRAAAAPGDVRTPAGRRPGLYTANTASQLTNTLVYEVQQGTTQLIGALLTLVKDTLTLLALLGYLLWLNWQLTLFVGLLFPTLAW